MTTIPFITSIPPKMYRIDAAGNDIGADYQLACINSWKEAGFKPVSLNHESEILPSEIENIVEVHKVRDSAFQEVGRHLLYLDSLFETAVKLDERLVAISNADILLDLSQDTKMTIGNLRPGEFFISHRLDIDDYQKKSAPEICFGYDFIVFCPADIEKLRWIFDKSYIFGKPFWDYAIPAAFIVSGLSGRLIDHHQVMHLRHPAKWNSEEFLSFVDKFRVHAAEYLTTKRAITESLQLTEFKQSFSSPNTIVGVQFLKYIIKCVLFRNQFRYSEIHLWRTAAATTKLLKSAGLHLR